MKVYNLAVLLGGAAVASASAALHPSTDLKFAANPIFDGWFADPEIRVYDDVYWIFMTTSMKFKDQKYFEAWSTQHPNILTAGVVPWVKDSMWAPASTKGPDGKYYLYFSDHTGVRKDKRPNAGMAVAVADKPEGPYKDALNGTRLFDDAVHGAYPMDPDVFVDDDGERYFYFGGGKKSNVGMLDDDMVSFRRINSSSSAKGKDDEYFKITTPKPSKFEEGTKIFKRKGKYYMMWSEYGYGDEKYQVAYGTSDSPLGPFSPKGVVLKQDPQIAVATGHNSVLNIPGTDTWYIVYHRRPLHETNVDHRVVAMDRMYFDVDGNIKPVKMRVEDDFDDGLLSLVLWKQRTGIWAITDGGDLRGSGLDALTLMDTHFKDLIYGAEITLEGDDSEAGLTFRTSRSKDKEQPAAFNGYAVWLKASTGEVILGHQTGHDKVQMAILKSSSGRHIKSGKKYCVRVVFKGTAVSVYVDDMVIPLMDVVDTSHGVGQNGLWVRRGRALFDNVWIRHP
ncbi:hypothetical protein Daus18300_005197 [Diaporthe australafricana]|uniref:Glycosyl hydrolase n=1 Tax=Diaporthe australafricana TaxID=127596 RepID=A0ABR3X447_9PEZI